jgi:hypothetical protein
MNEALNKTTTEDLSIEEGLYSNYRESGVANKDSNIHSEGKQV